MIVVLDSCFYQCPSDIKNKNSSFCDLFGILLENIQKCIIFIFKRSLVGLQGSQDRRIVESQNRKFAIFKLQSYNWDKITLQVGNEMVANGIKRCQMISYMVTLAAVTPIGMIIGIILTIHVDAQSGPMSRVFQDTFVSKIIYPLLF